MFEEDEHGDLLLAPTKKPKVNTISGAAAARIVASTISDILELTEPVPAPGPEIPRVKTLREMLYEQEPWRIADRPSSPAIRRLQERRVNRVMSTVADWMLAVVEQRIDDEMTLVVLLELAETVRQQIIWPELEASDVVIGLAHEAREAENSEKRP